MNTVINETILNKTQRRIDVVVVANALQSSNYMVNI